MFDFYNLFTSIISQSNQKQPNEYAFYSTGLSINVMQAHAALPDSFNCWRPIELFEFFIRIYSFYNKKLNTFC